MDKAAALVTNNERKLGKETPLAGAERDACVLNGRLCHVIHIAGRSIHRRIMVALNGDRATADLVRQFIDHRARLTPITDKIAEENATLGAFAARVCKAGLERIDVAMDIAEQCVNQKGSRVLWGLPL